MKDAGLKLSDVDGLFAMLPQDPFCGLTLAGYLGVETAFTENNRTGGSSFQHHVVTAGHLLEARISDVVLICYGSNQRTASGGLVSSGAPPFRYEAPYRPLDPISAYALAASRYMHEYGATREDLAKVAVSAREWAKLNPEAFARDDLSIEDCVNARLVSDPLSVRDCCLVTDGGAAIVMMRADAAADRPEPPVQVLGAGAATSHRYITTMPDLTVTAAKQSARAAFGQAGLRPADIDMVQLYDAFTINTLLFLEDLGFCAKGEAPAFIADGGIAPGGRLPVNTNGGGLSCVHPGMYGLFLIVEAVRQLRGEAGERQIDGARTALTHANGGVLSSQATLILGTEA